MSSSSLHLSEIIAQSTFRDKLRLDENCQDAFSFVTFHFLSQN
jgi:hypothetical protein